MKKLRLEDLKLLEEGIETVDDELLQLLCYERAISTEFANDLKIRNNL
mgnify:CR=1 FL=1